MLLHFRRNGHTVFERGCALVHPPPQLAREALLFTDVHETEASPMTPPGRVWDLRFSIGSEPPQAMPLMRG